MRNDGFRSLLIFHDYPSRLTARTLIFTASGRNIVVLRKISAGIGLLSHGPVSTLPLVCAVLRRSRFRTRHGLECFNAGFLVHAAAPEDGRTPIPLRQLVGVTRCTCSRSLDLARENSKPHSWGVPRISNRRLWVINKPFAPKGK